VTVCSQTIPVFWCVCVATTLPLTLLASSDLLGLVWFANHGFGLVSAGFGSKILKPKPKPWKQVWFGLVLV
jgi:hypothetical protein